MEAVFDDDVPPAFADGTAAAVGLFDGVHLGHQAVLTQLRRTAAELGVPSVVATFDRHPEAPLLTDLDQKLELLGEQMVDYTYVLRDAWAPPSTLIDTLNVRALVSGPDPGLDPPETLAIPVTTVDAVSVPDCDGAPVSSSGIRDALDHNDLEWANRLLARLYEVRGVVERGDGRGAAELNCPTANVAVAGDIALPADGVFAGWYERPDGATHMAAISLGRRPTFYVESGLRLLEAHLLDFRGDLYGEPARLRFAHVIRGQRRFESVDELIAEMERDVATVRQLLGAVQ